MTAFFSRQSTVLGGTVAAWRKGVAPTNLRECLRNSHSRRLEAWAITTPQEVAHLITAPLQDVDCALSLPCRCMHMTTRSNARQLVRGVQHSAPVVVVPQVRAVAQRVPLELVVAPVRQVVQAELRIFMRCLGMKLISLWEGGGECRTA